MPKAAVARASSYKPLISYWHTAALLAFQIWLAYRSDHRVLVVNGELNISRITIYQNTMLFQWGALAFIVVSLLLAKGPLEPVLGRSWKDLRTFLADCGLGLGFLVIVVMSSSILQTVLHAPLNTLTKLILPKNPQEMLWWVGLSLTAGICEEAIYRGYFQHQFSALANNPIVGIVLSAALFGGLHLYQGWQNAMIIMLLGLAGGWLVQWRRSTRPGMIAHVLQDVLGGFLRG